MTENQESKSFADRRADPDAHDEPDIAAEHEPSPTDPPNASDDAPGGEDEGFTPQTRT
jgi:hypothetical protein